MLDKRIVFEERYDCEEYGTTTLYFIAPKELLYNDYPEAVSAEICIECPMEHIEPAYAAVGISPTDEDGSDYDWCDFDLPYDIIGRLIDLAHKNGGDNMYKETFDMNKYPKTYNYVMENDTVNRRCNRCGSVVLKETNIKGYPYQCMACDENMYEMETHIGEPHTNEELDELLVNTLVLCLDE